MNFAKLKTLMEEHIPFNRYLGLQAEWLAQGHAVLRMPYRAELIGDGTRPALHGGALSALADTCGGAVIFSTLERGQACSTIDLRIDFLRPAGPEDVLAEGKLVRAGHSVGVAHIRLYQGEEPERREIATSTAVYNITRPKSP